MSDARELLRRYILQQQALGLTEIVLDRPGGGAPEPAAVPQTAPPEDPMPAKRPEHRHQRKTSARARPAKGPKWRVDLPPIPDRGLDVAAPADDLFTESPLRSATLDEIATMVAGCTDCPLHEGRTNTVPGEGPADAQLVVVGEGPGRNEDEQGRPFVGRAGDLLNDILAAIECPRETVYIANIVKCRPPNNRKPTPDECATCVPYLQRQLEIIGPKVILAMGGTAAETLLGTRASLSSLRNKVHSYRGIPLIVTYHPAALLRNPHWKRPTWDDVRIARQLLDR